MKRVGVTEDRLGKPQVDDEHEVTHRLDRRPLAVHALLQLRLGERGAALQRRLERAENGGFVTRLVDARDRNDRRRWGRRVGD